MKSIRWPKAPSFLPAATKLGQGNIFTGVCLSTGGGGLPQCMLGYTPPDQTPRSRHPPGPNPPRADTPPGTRPPWSRHPLEQTPQGSRLQHTINERPVRILVECILVAGIFLHDGWGMGGCWPFSFQWIRHWVKVITMIFNTYAIVFSFGIIFTVSFENNIWLVNST